MIPVKEPVVLVETFYNIGCPFSIALLADFHNNIPDPVLESLRSHNPEIIAIAGDFIFGDMPKGWRIKIKENFRALKLLEECPDIAPTFVSLGNHEYTLSDEDYEVLRSTKVTLLDNTWTNYHGMIIFAVIGVIVNFIAAYTTREGNSINQKAFNLHMLEDVLGWVVVLVGAIIMNFTDIKILDPIMSIGVAIFILVNALKNLKKVLDVFLEKTPNDIDIDELKEHLLKINEVEDIHHIHIWSIDGYNNYATMHIVTKSNNIKEVKKNIREELEEHNICHAILETEDEVCDDEECHVDLGEHHHHHHH